MSARTIETKAIISAEDKTGNAFSAVVQKLAKMEAAAKHANTSLGSVDRAAATTRRAELAHHREMIKVQREIQHHGTAKYVASAAASAVAAHSIVEAITESLKGGAELQHSLTALKNSGRTVEEIAEIMSHAGEVMKAVPTSSLKENLDTILETTGAFGNLHHAMENLEFVQKITSVLKAAGDGEASSKSVAYDFAKFAEIRGSAGDTKRLQAESNEMTRGMVFTGGKFNPHEAFAFAQQTSALLGKYSVHFLSRILPSLATEAGGERTGTRANAFANVIMGKARDKKQTEEWVRLGLLDPSQVINSKQGPTGWKAGAVKETNLALSDPDVFAEKVLIPAMKAKGINTEDSFAVTKELNQLFRNGESNRFATAVVDTLQRSRLHKDDENIGKAGDVDAIYKRNLSEDPTVAMSALTESLHSLMDVVSQPAMKTAASGLSALAGGIQTLAASLSEHPLVALAGGTAVAGGALAGAGTMAYKLANGFGLSTSAEALDGAAIQLEAAALKLGAAGTLGASEAAADKFLAGGIGANALKTGGKAAGILGMGAAGSAAVLTGGLLAFDYAMGQGLSWYKDANPKLFRGGARAQAAYASIDAAESPIPAAGHYEGGRYGRGGWHDRSYVFDPQRTPFNGTTPLAQDVSALPSMSSFQPLAKMNYGSRSSGPIAPLGAAPAFTTAPLPQKIDVAIEQPPPLKVEVTVTASSALLQVEQAAKAATVQLRARADTGPGGLGETHTGQ